MFFEIFLCGSFEVESIEELVFLLYVEILEDDFFSLLIKKLVMDIEFLRFVEMVNIEDQMMSEDEIVQVNVKSGDVLKLNMCKDYQEIEVSYFGKKNVDDVGRCVMEGNNVYEVV